MYQVLNEEMKTRPTEKVKDALILNLLVRIDLLNQQRELEDSKWQKNKRPQRFELKGISDVFVIL